MYKACSRGKLSSSHQGVPTVSKVTCIFCHPGEAQPLSSYEQNTNNGYFPQTMRKIKCTQSAMCYPSCSASGFSPSTLPHQPTEAKCQEQGIHPLQLNLHDSLPDGSQLIQNYHRRLFNWSHDSRAQEPHQRTALWHPCHMDLTSLACSPGRIHEFSSWHRHQLGLAVASKPSWDLLEK